MSAFPTIFTEDAAWLSGYRRGPKFLATLEQHPGCFVHWNVRVQSDEGDDFLLVKGEPIATALRALAAWSSLPRVTVRLVPDKRAELGVYERVRARLEAGERAWSW